MMCSILNQHPDVIIRGQILKDDPEYQRELQAMGMLPFTGKLFDDEVDSRRQFDRLETAVGEREPRNAGPVIESFYRGQSLDSHRSVVGFKFHGGTLYRDEIEEILLGEQPYTLMMLHRSNLLAAGISWYQARQLNQWVSRSSEVRKPPITIDVELLKEFVYRTRDDVEGWKKLLRQHNHPFLELTYEQITDATFSYEFVWHYLGVNPIPTPKPKTHKLIKDYSHIQNLEEIRRAFAGQGLGEV